MIRARFLAVKIRTLRRLVQVLLLRHTWFKATIASKMDARFRAAVFGFTFRQLDMAAMRKMGRDLGISLNPKMRQ
jgi:hypothetical protein